jgi:hypothetical protein
VSHEHYAARRHPEFVVLEIGAEMGALIVHAPAAMHGVEIEITPDGNDTSRSHKQVLERLSGGRPAYTAVFDGLTSGTYTLWTDGVPRVRGVEVAGGAVARLAWPAKAGREGLPADADSPAPAA